MSLQKTAGGMTSFALAGDLRPDESYRDYGKCQDDRQRFIIRFERVQGGAVTNVTDARRVARRLWRPKVRCSIVAISPRDEMVETLGLIDEGCVSPAWRGSRAILRKRSSTGPGKPANSQKSA